MPYIFCLSKYLNHNNLQKAFSNLQLPELKGVMTKSVFCPKNHELFAARNAPHLSKFPGFGNFNMQHVSIKVAMPLAHLILISNFARMCVNGYGWHEKDG